MIHLVERAAFARDGNRSDTRWSITSDAVESYEFTGRDFVFAEQANRSMGLFDHSHAIAL